MSHKFERLLAFAYMVLVLLWPLGFVLWLLKLFIENRLFYQLSGGQFSFIDFVSFYRCGDLALTPPAPAFGRSIYDEQVQLAAYNSVIAPLHVNNAPYAEYVPWTFLLMQPFALVPMPWAYLIWTLLTLCLGLGALTLLLQSRQNFSMKQAACFLVAALSFYPSLMCIHDGQNSWLMLSIAAFFLLCYRKGQDVKAGLLLALLSVKPQYLIFLMIPPLVKKRWRLIVSAFIAISAFVLLSIARFGAATIFTYPEVVARATVEANNAFPSWLVCLRGPLSMLLPSAMAFQLANALCIASLFGVAFIFLKSKQQNDAMLFAITIVAMLLFSPHTHIYDLTLLALAAALTVQPGFPKQENASRQRFNWQLLFTLLPIVGMVVFVLTELLPIHEIVALIFFALDAVLLLSGLSCLKGSFQHEYPS